MGDSAFRAIFRPILLVILIGTVGCGTSYQRINGKWCYVTIDEGHGRRARELPVDMDSFTVLSGGPYAKDKNSVFFEGRIIEGADPSTFAPIPHTTSRLMSYGKDASHVYLTDRGIIGADPGSFRVVEGPYSRDNTRFYCGCVPMEVAHPDMFEVVYWSGTIETGGDELVKSFGPSFRDIDTTVIVALGWARDGEFYYFGPRRITDRDYATMEITDGSEARDKDGVFWGDLMLQPIHDGKDGEPPQPTSHVDIERESV